MADLISIRKHPYLIIFILVVACEQPPFSVLKEEPGLTPEETLVGRDWRYRDLIIAGDTLNRIVVNFEPDPGFDDFQFIKFRWFRYMTNKTYEFRHDTQWLGLTIGGDDQSPNYQPAFGYWKVNDSGDTLIHNEWEASKTKYFIVHLSDTLFIREYERIVMETSDSLRWPLGDTVTYREVFVPKIN